MTPPPPSAVLSNVWPPEQWKKSFFLLSNPNLPCRSLRLFSQVPSLQAGQKRPDFSYSERAMRSPLSLLQAKLPQVPQLLLTSMWGKGDFWGCPKVPFSRPFVLNVNYKTQLFFFLLLNQDWSGWWHTLFFSPLVWFDRWMCDHFQCWAWLSVTLGLQRMPWNVLKRTPKMQISWPGQQI